MVNDDTGQVDHCRLPVEWKGVWKDVNGRFCYVEPCGDHAPKVTVD
jgi:hypothetical protein